MDEQQHICDIATRGCTVNHANSETITLARRKDDGVCRTIIGAYLARTQLTKRANNG